MKINFFTIVLNGMPYINKHIKEFLKLPFDWNWHIVEGLAELKHDTAWSLASGGREPLSHVKEWLSVDGTTEYLNQLAKNHPNKVHLYRKESGFAWDGKIEMIKAPLKNISNPCLLWQIDADEIWSSAQIMSVRDAFISNSSLTAAFYWCNYFVGPKARICTRNCYSQNPRQEWLRTWFFQPGDVWKSHEPPTLVRRNEFGVEVDVAKINPLMHRETEKIGAIFNHYAYVTVDQIRFKEIYYGYKGAVAGWQRLQSDIERHSPLLLSEYFPWVEDLTAVAKVDSQSLSGDSIGVYHMPNVTNSKPVIILDGVAFQDNHNPGICRVWQIVLSEWLNNGFSERVCILNRGSTMPHLPGYTMIDFPKFNEEERGSDAILLEEACLYYKADVFMSTNYTSSIETPSVTLVHDCIPESLGHHMKGATWQEKSIAIAKSHVLVTVSKNTADDLKNFYIPNCDRSIFVAPLGVSSKLTASNADAVSALKSKLGLTKPFFIFVGERIGLCGEETSVRGYKNCRLLFEAFSQWNRASEFHLILVGGKKDLEPEFNTFASTVKPILASLSDVELSAAYSDATALVYSSKYEGFGLPILEAMSLGCPVICSKISSMPEVAGDAAVLIDPSSVSSLIEALESVSLANHKERLTKAGIERSKMFCPKRIADTIQKALEITVGQQIGHEKVFRILRSLQAEWEAVTNAPRGQRKRRSVLSRVTREISKALIFAKKNA